MDKETIILGGHGLGDCLLSIQCASFVESPRCLISVRDDEIWKPLQYCFNGSRFTLERVDAKFSHEDAILKNESLLREIADPDRDEFYYVIPDLLFKNRYAFDYNRHNTHPQTIKSTRLLQREWRPKKIIYFGLATSTNGYGYYDTEGLLKSTAELLPDYTIYFPNVARWDGQELDAVNPLDMPSNVHVHESPSFPDSIDWLKKSCYFVGTCNGPSHLAYHYGIPRLILDPQYGKMPWVARWKENYNECIPIDATMEMISLLIKTNINVPQSCLIDRRDALKYITSDWKQTLLIKEI